MLEQPARVLLAALQLLANPSNVLRNQFTVPEGLRNFEVVTRITTALPDISAPFLFVQIPYTGSTPEEVERTIIRPVEESLATMTGIKRMRSSATSEAALIFIDLDRFKAVNDSLGHDIGDRLLVEIAQRLYATLDTDDLVARLGAANAHIVRNDSPR